VDEIEVARLVPGLGAQHSRGERAQLAWQVVLAEPLERAGGHVAHSHPGHHLDHRIQLRRRGPREHLHRDPALGHATRRLGDVHVHAARVAGARLLQR
jgi:hypothetical protein